MSSQKSTAAVAALEPKRRRGRERVAAILEAAAEVFAQKGYDGATMTEIAARAATAIGSLYRFFPTKDALAEALLARYQTTMREALADVVREAPGTEPKALADMLARLMLDHRKDRAAALVLVDVGSHGAVQREALREAMLGGIKGLIAAASPAVAPERIETVAVVLLHMLKALPRLADEDKTPDQRTVTEATAMIALYLESALCPPSS